MSLPLWTATVMRNAYYLMTAVKISRTFASSIVSVSERIVTHDTSLANLVL